MMASIVQGISTLFRSHTEVLATLGAVTVLYLSLKAVFTFWHGVKVYILAKTLGLGINIKSFGSWAVVTGSTDGIGQSYAEQLAQLGLNVVLISRSPDKLAAVAKEIEEKYQVKTKCIPIDFTSELIIYSTIAEGLKGLDIAVLVNNVGMSIDHPMFLTEATDKTLNNVITVNCNAVTFMTKLVLPKMVEKQKGVIINISSQSGLRPVPLLSVYSATKAYVEFFSAAVSEEYKSKGIIVQCISPGFVATKMSKIRKASFFAPSPDSYVRSALPTLGVTARADGCIAHAIQGFLMLKMPSWLYYKVTKSLMLPARARAMKKQQKAQ
jgi:17beta-estradiol 17-dehydrogenase / very-long-chain 3-oxoacyl-CoA reductase